MNIKDRITKINTIKLTKFLKEQDFQNIKRKTMNEFYLFLKNQSIYKYKLLKRNLRYPPTSENLLISNIASRY